MRDYTNRCPYASRFVWEILFVLLRAATDKSGGISIQPLMVSGNPQYTLRQTVILTCILPEMNQNHWTYGNNNQGASTHLKLGFGFCSWSFLLSFSSTVSALDNMLACVDCCHPTAIGHLFLPTPTLILPPLAPPTHTYPGELLQCEVKIDT